MIIGELFVIEMEIEDMLNDEEIDKVFCNSVISELIMAKRFKLIDKTKYNEYVEKIRNKFSNVKGINLFKFDREEIEDNFWNNDDTF